MRKYRLRVFKNVIGERLLPPFKLGVVVEINYNYGIQTEFFC